MAEAEAEAADSLEAVDIEAAVITRTEEGSGAADEEGVMPRQYEGRKSFASTTP